MWWNQLSHDNPPLAVSFAAGRQPLKIRASVSHGDSETDENSYSLALPYPMSRQLPSCTEIIANAMFYLIHIHYLFNPFRTTFTTNEMSVRSARVRPGTQPLPFFL